MLRRRADLRQRAALAGGVLATIALIAAPATISAIETTLDREAILRALTIAHGDPLALGRFHQRYQFDPNVPPLDSLEVLTPFRRIVLGAETHAAIGDRTWGYREAVDLVEPYRRTVTLVLHVQLPPQNVYVTLPPFELMLYPAPGTRGEARSPLKPANTIATPQYLPGQLAPAGSPILGGTVEYVFDTAALDLEGQYLAAIFEKERERVRVPIDFSLLE